MAIRVAFLGGSITWGAGADSYEESWAYRTGKYLEQIFTGQDIICQNVGISGTGSRLGVFRLEKQVLDFHPDIVFYEFAVNDLWESIENEENILAAMEYNVRMLLKQNPDVQIIVVLSARKGYATAAATHRKVADHYHLPVIDCQAAVRVKLRDDLQRWGELFVDDVHPSSAGHQLYFETIRNYLNQHRKDVFFTDRGLLPEPLVPIAYYHPNLLDAGDCIKIRPDWKEMPYQDVKRAEVANVNKMQFTDKPGAAAEFDFYGESFGIYHLVREDCGKLLIRIDEEPAEVLDCYYQCSGDFVSFYNKYHLGFGKHHVSITVGKDKNQASSGYSIGIAAFLIH